MKLRHFKPNIMIQVIKNIKNVFNSIFEIKTKEVNPEDYGWTLEWRSKDWEIYYKDGIDHRYSLSQGDKIYQKTWCFDRDKKTAPGVIARFDFPLIPDDLEFANAHIEKQNEIYKNKNMMNS